MASEIHKLCQGKTLTPAFSIRGAIDKDPSQNPFCKITWDRPLTQGVGESLGSDAEIAGQHIKDNIMPANSWALALLIPSQARKLPIK